MYCPRCDRFACACTSHAQPIVSFGSEGDLPLVPNPCSICGKPIISGAYVGTGDGTM
jgi:hypothetical protein